MKIYLEIRKDSLTVTMLVGNDWGRSMELKLKEEYLEKRMELKTERMMGRLKENYLVSLMALMMGNLKVVSLVML